MSITQKEAVLSAVTEVLGSSFTPHQTVAKDLLTKEQMKEIKATVTNAILNGEVNYSKDISDTKKVAAYVASMVNDSLRKDKVLNGGVPYTPSRTGVPRDAQLKALNQILASGKLQEGSEDYIIVTEQIAARKSQLEQERALKKASSAVGKVDTSMLPTDLQELANELANNVKI